MTGSNRLVARFLYMLMPTTEFTLLRVGRRRYVFDFNKVFNGYIYYFHKCPIERWAAKTKLIWTDLDFLPEKQLFHAVYF
jgi:hypothetical protein